MAVSRDSFIAWIEDKFGDEYSLAGKDICINSIFQDDTNHKLWCRTEKEGRPFGVFRCFKSDEKGNLVRLIMLVDGCDYQTAIDILIGEDYSKLEQELEEIFRPKIESKKQETVDLSFPPNTYKICEIPNNFIRNKVEKYLNDRKLPEDDFFYCVKGKKYWGRVIIPYYNKENKLIYWNARATGDFHPKYRAPDKDLYKIGKGDVLYCPKYPKKGELIHITEGEFDAYSLYISGLYSCAIGGKFLTETQMELLKDYKPVICLDTDSAGENSLKEIGKKLIATGQKEVFYVRPPENYKDWNQMLVELNPKLIQAYIINNIQRFNEWTEDLLISWKV